MPVKDTFSKRVALVGFGIALLNIVGLYIWEVVKEAKR